MRLFTDKQQIKRVWEVRESALGATSHVPGEPLEWEGWEDSAVARRRNLDSYLRDLTQTDGLATATTAPCTDTLGMPASTCASISICSQQQGIANYRKFVEEAADLVVGYGGSLSGEHGDGQSRAELLPKMFGPELVQAFPRIQGALGPGVEDESGQGGRAIQVG